MPEWSKEPYLIRVAVAFDQFINVVIGGSPDETMSARAGRLRYSYPKTWGALAWVLDHIQRDHASMALDNDLGRAEYVREMEERAAAMQAEAVDEEIKRQLEEKI